MTTTTLSKLIDARDLIEAAIQELVGKPAPWSYPVGIGPNDWPTEKWYAATVHDTSGKLNGGYKHTGIDLNMDKAPWGDVDRGAPVYAIADGVVTEKGYSNSYLGSIVLLVDHLGDPLYVRYWHLERETIFNSVMVGDRVQSGLLLAKLGNYTLGAGGDHLHFDMALDPFGPHWWHTNHAGVRWVDPVPVLKMHLDPVKVDAMMRRGD